MGHTITQAEHTRRAMELNSMEFVYLGLCIEGLLYGTVSVR